MATIETPIPTAIFDLKQLEFFIGFLVELFCLGSADSK